MHISIDCLLHVHFMKFTIHWKCINNFNSVKLFICLICMSSTCHSNLILIFCGRYKDGLFTFLFLSAFLEYQRYIISLFTEDLWYVLSSIKHKFNCRLSQLWEPSGGRTMLQVCMYTYRSITPYMHFIYMVHYYMEVE